MMMVIDYCALTAFRLLHGIEKSPWFYLSASNASQYQLCCDFVE